MKFHAFVAKRYLKAKRKQAFIGVISLITLIGTTLGVASLNIGLSIHNGMHNAFEQSLIGKTGQLYILSRMQGLDGFDAEAIAEIQGALKKVEGIQAVSPMRTEYGVIISQRKVLRFAKLNGVDPELHLKVSELGDQMQAGSFTQMSHRPDNTFPGVVIGADLARSLGVALGDYVRIGVPRISASGLSRQGFRLRELKAEVTGIFKTGNSQFDETDVYLTLDELLPLLNKELIQSLLVSFTSKEAMEKGKEELLVSRDMPLFATVADLRDLNRNLLAALKMEKVATTFVICLFILIVALNMVSALTMLVMEKHRDIGIMKSFGTPDKVILKIFIRQGMTLALKGTLLGSILGVGIGMVADHYKLIRLDNSVYEVLNYLPFQIDPNEVVLVAIGSLILSFLTCIFPAKQAASLDPVEALKYD